MPASLTDRPPAGVTAPDRITFSARLGSGSRIWVVAGPLGAVEVAATYVVPAGSPKVVRDRAGRRMQIETVTVHRRPTGDDPVRVDCPVLGACDDGPMSDEAAVTVLRRWAAGGHNDALVEFDLLRLYAALLAGGAQ